MSVLCNEKKGPYYAGRKTMGYETLLGLVAQEASLNACSLIFFGDESPVHTTLGKFNNGVFILKKHQMSEKFDYGVSLRKLIKCFLSTRNNHRRHKSLTAPSRDFKMFSVHTIAKTQSRQFVIPRVWKSVFKKKQETVDGRRNRRKKSCGFKFHRRSVDTA